jgi:LysR family transcriptional regulator, transcriptional activator for leuABCD operon
MLNLRAVDLNLLPVFEAIYEERSLSRAATRVAMTQSAVSHALSRLRLVFRDELFIRQPRGVIPTAAADALYAKLRGALASVRESIVETRGFDPARSDRKFFVSISHPLGPMIAIRLRERLDRVAPGVDVIFSTRSRPVELERAMREGRIDAAVDWLVPANGKFREVTLFEDGLVAMARSGHPAVRTTRSISELTQGAFVSLRPRVEGEHPVAGLREWQRLKLRVVLEVSEILEVFMVVRQSDLFGLIPLSMIRFAREVFGLRPLQAGPRRAPVPIKLVWAASRESEPAHAFLREHIRLAATDVAVRGRWQKAPRAP